MATEKYDLISDDMSDRIVDVAASLATAEGAHNVTVRKVLQTLQITNRVFYNRFHNIGEVLELVYRRIIMKIRESVEVSFNPNQDFFEQVIGIVEKTLMLSYELKMEFNQFVFENDSVLEENFIWWTNKIKMILDYAKEHNYVKPEIDSGIMSYGIWCFIKGFNADAVARNLPKEEAARYFRYSLGFLINGIRA